MVTSNHLPSFLHKRHRLDSERKHQQKMHHGERTLPVTGLAGSHKGVVLYYCLLIVLQIQYSASLLHPVSNVVDPRPGRSSTRLASCPESFDVSPQHSRAKYSRRSLIRDTTSGLLFFLSALPASAETSGLPKITDRVVFDVRVSRSDGTFYTRGDETDEERKFYSVTVGLFGKAAPTHVERFLSYVRPSEEVLRDDRPFPAYSQSQFKSFDQATGVLFGGTIPSLEVTAFGGSTALKYGGRILPAPLWLERKANDDIATEDLPLPHSTKGLLIHRKLDPSPEFGITTRSDSGSYVSDFDRDYVAFGKVLEGMDFLNYCQELPTYSVERAVQDDNPVKDAIFNAQREFFRGAAKSMGDTRVAKVYPGKLLRRVEVTRVSTL